MVAQRLSDRRIAQELCLSERTVEKHLSKIVRKLRLTPRAQIASWGSDNSNSLPRPIGFWVLRPQAVFPDNSFADLSRDRGNRWNHLRFEAFS